MQCLYLRSRQAPQPATDKACLLPSIWELGPDTVNMRPQPTRSPRYFILPFVLLNRPPVGDSLHQTGSRG